MKPIWMKLAVLVLGSVLLSSQPLHGDEECDVSSSVSQADSVEGYKYIAHTFEVKLEIDEQCADISYTLVITERTKDDEEKRKLMPRSLQLRSRSTTEHHTTRTASGVFRTCRISL